MEAKMISGFNVSFLAVNHLNLKNLPKSWFRQYRKCQAKPKKNYYTFEQKDADQLGRF